MSDTGARLRALFEEIGPPIDIRRVIASREVVVVRQQGWLIAVAAGVVTLLVGLGAWFLVARSPGGPAVSTVPTTSVPTVTTVQGAGSPESLYDRQAGPLPPAAVCPPGSTPDTPGDPAAPRPPVATEVLSTAFDRESGLLVLSVSGTTWSFDPCWNRWQEMSAHGPNLGSGDPMVYDADSDLIVAFDDTDAWTYDVDSDTWTLAGRHDSSLGGLMLYHDPSGLIVGPGPNLAGIKAYDVATDTLATLSVQEPALSERVQSVFPYTHSSRPIVVYDPLGDHFYLYATELRGVPTTWRYDPGEGWTELPISTPYVTFGYGDMNWGVEQAFDLATGRMVIFSAGIFAAFDPSESAWEILAAPDGLDWEFGVNVVYDTANGRLILLWGAASDVWAFDTRNREWIQLLAAA